MKVLSLFFPSKKVWITTLISFLLGPSFGFCYLGKGKTALFYLLGGLLVVIAIFVMRQYDIISMHPVHLMNNGLLALDLAGTAHCFTVARRQEIFSHSRWYSRWYALASFMLIPLCLALLFRLYCYEPFHIPSISMSPTINSGDYLFISKFAYKHSLPQRGDVVVLKVSKKNSTFYTLLLVKRIIGLPGDTIQIKENNLYINDTATITMPLGTYTLFPQGKEALILDQFIETLPEGKVIKILKEPKNAEDTPVFVVPQGHYFVLGDNRNRSHDSRSTALGFIPEKDIKGKASVVIWNDNTTKLSYSPIE